MEAKNLKEFKALIERYETITIEEIKKKWVITFFSGCDTARLLTGFGRCHTCSLCKVVQYNGEWDCNQCVYGGYVLCMKNKNDETYHEIMHSKSPEQLLTAFRNRAAHLRKTYLI